MTDLFGQIMWAAYREEDSFHQIERDDGYITDSTGEQYVSNYDEWPESERLALDLVEGSVLDIGCGASRIGVYLQEKGHEVIGIDVSKGAVEISRKRGLKKAYLMSADNLEFSENRFDTVILFGNNFGMLGEPEKITDMMKQIYRVTTPEAIVLAETRDPKATDEEAHFKYHERNRSLERPEGLARIRLLFNNQIGEWFELLMVDPEDMAAIVESAGWRIRETCGPRELYVAVLEKSI